MLRDAQLSFLLSPHLAPGCSTSFTCHPCILLSMANMQIRELKYAEKVFMDSQLYEPGKILS